MTWMQFNITVEWAKKHSSSVWSPQQTQWKWIISVCEKMKVTVSRRFGSQFASAIINFLRKTEHPVGSHPTHRTSQQELQILGTIAAFIRSLQCSSLSVEVRSCSTTLLISCSYLVLLLKHRPRWLFLAYNSGFHTCFFFFISDVKSH